ncbi:MAG: hypothetical protein WCA08_24795, partial [Desulfoferrobacter sp.]
SWDSTSVRPEVSKGELCHSCFDTSARTEYVITLIRDEPEKAIKIDCKKAMYELIYNSKLGDFC